MCLFLPRLPRKRRCALNSEPREWEEANNKLLKGPGVLGWSAVSWVDGFSANARHCVVRRMLESPARLGAWAFVVAER